VGSTGTAGLAWRHPGARELPRGRATAVRCPHAALSPVTRELILWRSPTARCSDALEAHGFLVKLGPGLLRWRRSPASRGPARPGWGEDAGARSAPKRCALLAATAGSGAAGLSFGFLHLLCTFLNKKILNAILLSKARYFIEFILLKGYGFKITNTTK